MARSPSNIADLSNVLAKSGLICFGGLELTVNECASGSEGSAGCKALLIGNTGTQMWRVFSASDEYIDGERDSMNRWTKRLLDDVAKGIEARVIYPFDEPYWPFQSLAQKAAGVQPSPLGILMHPEFGLWHAFRGLFVFEQKNKFTSQINILIENAKIMDHPCDDCIEKPCLTACPVGAFTGEQLDVQLCFGHLDSGQKPDCMSLGCQARCACPIAKEHQYDDAQLQFHMKSYRGL